MNRNWSWADVQHFEPREFRCPCGVCGSDGHEMDVDFVIKLDQVRERLGIPMLVTSGYRCPSWNSQVSTTGQDGPHTTGRAADIHIYGGNAHRLILQASLGGWFTGIGLQQKGEIRTRFIHLDDLAGPAHPRPWIWTY